MTPLDTPTAIMQRRSIKTFKTDQIPTELLHKLLELTVAAPSGWNLQDWQIILVQDQAQKNLLQEAAFGQTMIGQAPITFVFAANINAGEENLDPIFDQARKNEAWTEATINYFKAAIPQSHKELGEKKREQAIKNAMIAATHLVLAAESLGLSSTFMNGWSEEKVKEVIGAVDNSNIVIAVLVSVGYAAESRKNPGRLPLNNNVYIDKIGNSIEIS